MLVQGARAPFPFPDLERPPAVAVRSLYTANNFVSEAKGPAITIIGRTVHSSSSLISSKGALRRRRGPLLRRDSRLLDGMLGGLLILGRGRGKTRSTTSLVGHDPTK